MARLTEHVRFEGASGATLDARLELPEGGEPVGYAIFAHCFTCSKHLFAPTRISRALAGHGIATLRFDFTGLGHSEGEFENTSFSSNVGDLVAAARFLEAQHEAPKLLIGHSLGGSAVLMAAAQIEACRAVATINAPCEPEHVERLFGGSIATIEGQGKAEVTLQGRTFTITDAFLDDLRSHRMTETIAGLSQALLVCHAPRDEMVGIDNATRIFTSAKHPKSFIGLDGADHLLTDAEDAAWLASMIAAWAPRYTEFEKQAEQRPPDEYSKIDPDTVVVTEAEDGHYKAHVVVGRHHLLADEPAEVGGEDAGPSPYDLVSAALGACTTMTMRMYAERKAWPLDRVKVELRHSKIHAEDCDHCEEKTGKIDRIERVIHIEGDALDDDQRHRLFEIANKCPVHRTLHRANDVVSTLAETGERYEDLAEDEEA